MNENTALSIALLWLFVGLSIGILIGRSWGMAEGEATTLRQFVSYETVAGAAKLDMAYAGMEK